MDNNTVKAIKRPCPKLLQLAGLVVMKNIDNKKCYTKDNNADMSTEKVTAKVTKSRRQPVANKKQLEYGADYRGGLSAFV